jgi:vacuole morphology and inheritance protein 14
MVFLVHRFNSENSLLQKRGTLALQKLCTLLGAERVYRELATILEGEADLEFATVMVQVSFLGKLSWSLPLKILD